ncbi:MAG: peptidylprolyl isomerase [Chloroflexi bacterium]|nr:peptidylprolyl isomerase [Chloroflexota bacterium]
MRRWSIGLVIGALWALAACSAANVPENVQLTATSGAVLPMNAQGVPLVARVNGAEITLPQLERALARTQQEGYSGDVDLLRRNLLETLIDQTLIEQAAAQMNISVSAADLEAEYQANVQVAGSEQALRDWMAINQYTEAEYRDSLRVSLLTTRVRDAVTQEVAASVAQVHARHILVASEEEANQILAELQAGADFAILATRSLDVTTRDSGGDLGWFARGDLMEPALADVAFALQVGEIAGPVATRLGYHIIQVLEIGERSAAPEDLPTLAQTRFESWLAEQRAAASIERFL